MAHTLPELPYSYQALDNFVGAQTMEIHAKNVCKNVGNIEVSFLILYIFCQNQTAYL